MSKFNIATRFSEKFLLPFLHQGLLLLLLGGQVACASRPIAVSELPGIANDQLIEALSTFTVSCEAYDQLQPGQAIVPGYAGPRAPNSDPQRVQHVCREARAVLENKPSNSAVLAFLDQHFLAYPMADTASPGLMTAYYEPVIPISMTKTRELDYPLYGVPPSLKPKEAWYTRKEIETGVADEALKDVILAYTTRWAAYVIGIQGSGIGRLDNGAEVMINYADRNNRAYTGLGQILVKQGKVPQGQMSMMVLEKWFASHNKAEQDELYWKNASYVFFTLLNQPGSPDRLGPPGAMDLRRGLTPHRSAAVDWAHYTPGMPVYAIGTLGRQAPISRLLVAQDRGGAVKTGKKLDLFLGRGDAAQTQAGNTADYALQLWSLDFRRPLGSTEPSN